MHSFIASLGLLISIFCSVNGHLSSSAKFQCPVDDPKPCHCVEAYGNVFLECSKLGNREQLSAAFQKLDGHGITDLVIKNSNISHIPRTLFRNSPVSHIRIKNSMMFYLFDRELEFAANTLTEITLEGVDFEGGLDWDVLENLKSLQILSVSRSGIENIPYSASELELPVETLILQDNDLEHIYEYAFQNFKSLKNLKLNKNFLNKYERTMLPLPECGLQFLDLSYNKLASLPENAFDGMTELHSLLLRGNKLKILQKSYMQNIYSSLFYLDVANNPLVCDCEMTYLLSAVKPFHLFGQCTSLKTEKKKDLQELRKEDFANCVSKTNA